MKQNNQKTNGMFLKNDHEKGLSLLDYVKDVNVDLGYLEALGIRVFREIIEKNPFFI